MDLVLQVETLPAPGETVLTQGYQTKPGGKGNNQAVAARRAGATVAMVGCVGQDGFGHSLRQTLAAEGIDTSAVQAVDTPTGLAAIGIDARGENNIIVASGANLAVSAERVPGSWLSSETLVVLQQEVPAAANAAVIARAKAAGARVLLNLAPASGLDPALLQALDYLVLNEIEAAQLAAALPIPEQGYAAIAQALAQTFGLSCIVTLGAQGCFAATPAAHWHVPALPITPVDTTGAGDAFVGILAAGLDAGLPLLQALRRATVGSALACLALGAQAALPNAAAITARLAELPDARAH